MYYRQLELLEFDGYRMVSSEKMAWLCQVNPAQVRKDLGYFGEFGIRGVGYDVRDLQAQIKKILAVNRDWNVGVAGMGNLGSAFIEHQNLESGITIQDIGELESTADELDIEIAVITTPPQAAQHVADLFLKSQVNAILNFSPTRIRVPECCLIEHIYCTVRLDILTYQLRNEMGS